MKKLFVTLTFTFVFTVMFSNAKAQKMFDALPETAKFLPSVVEGIFNLNPGSAVDVKFTQGFHVTGVIKSNKKVYDNLQTIVIESSNYKANLFISKTIDQDNKVKYVGRMLGRGFQDGIELNMDNAGNNIIKKINLKDMIVE
jgi:hypothetical protein